MFFLILLCTGLEPKVFTIASIEKRVPLVFGDRFFVSAEKATLNGDQLYLVNNRDLDIWVYDSTKGSLMNFSGKGPGPGELRQLLTSFYWSDGSLQVIHSNGSRLESFTGDGSLIASKSVREQGAAFFVEGNLSITLTNQRFVLHEDGEERASVASFDMKTYGFGRHGGKLGNYVMIASDKSKNNTIPYVIFDLSTMTLHNKGVFQKRQKITEENVTESMKRALDQRGIQFEDYFFTTFNVIIPHDQWGFMLLEYDMNLYQSETRGYYSVIHALDPLSGNEREITLYHGDIKTPILAFPLKKLDRWLVLDSAEDEIVLVSVRPE